MDALATVVHDGHYGSNTRRRPHGCGASAAEEPAPAYCRGPGGVTAGTPIASLMLPTSVPGDLTDRVIRTLIKFAIELPAPRIHAADRGSVGRKAPPSRSCSRAWVGHGNDLASTRSRRNAFSTARKGGADFERSPLAALLIGTCAPLDLRTPFSVTVSQWSGITCVGWRSGTLVRLQIG